MKFSNLLMYKVVEFDGGIAIIAQQDNLKRPDAAPLMIGNSDTVAEYLARYLHAREAGKEITDAHNIALAGAKIIGPKLDPKTGLAS